MEDYYESMFYGAKPELFSKATLLRLNETEAEKELWKYLKKYKHKGIKFRRQHPINIFIADFYCHSLKLIIEIDGEVHLNIENKEYDKGRTAELSELGISVIRFTNDEIFNNIQDVLKRINQTIIYLENDSGQASL